VEAVVIEKYYCRILAWGWIEKLPAKRSAGTGT